MGSIPDYGRGWNKGIFKVPFNLLTVEFFSGGLEKCRHSNSWDVTFGCVLNPEVQSFHSVKKKFLNTEMVNIMKILCLIIRIFNLFML